MRGIPLLGRILFSSIFIVFGLRHFTQPMVDFAASQGVVFPEILVPAAGVLAFFGGLSVLLGFYARVGAWMIVAFLVPVTLSMHRFWLIADPSEAQIQEIMFMKNIAMMGGALVIAYFGSGPMSLTAETFDEEFESQVSGQVSGKPSRASKAA